MCTPLSCGVGFLLSSNGNECEAVVVTPPFQPSQNQKQKGDFPRGGVAHPELQYPRRRRQADSRSTVSASLSSASS